MANKDEAAFPAIEGVTAFYVKGLTKREYIAAMALQGLLAQSPGPDKANKFAKQAIIAADALLEELSKE